MAPAAAGGGVMTRDDATKDADPLVPGGEQRPGVQGGASPPAATWQCGVCGMETDSPVGHAFLCGMRQRGLVPKASPDAVDLLREARRILRSLVCGPPECALGNCPKTWSLIGTIDRFLAAHALEGTR